MASIEQLIQQLEGTKGDIHAQAAVTAEFLVSARPEAELEPLHAALDAAAVLRWFDVGLLARLLEIPSDEASKRVEVL